jgi:branched-chain amino acid transport system substrate-binding protein
MTHTVAQILLRGGGLRVCTDEEDVIMSRRPRWSLTAVAMVVGLALLLAACGGGKTPRGGELASTSSPSVTTAPDGPIVIGTVGSFTGTRVGSDLGAVQAITAWVDDTNAHGGLLGRPVKVVIKDDHGDAATSVAAVKELVETDHVVAIIADQSDVDQAWQRYVDGKNIPVIGGGPDSVPFLRDANFFPSGANVVALTYAAQLVAKTKGTNIGSVVCVESGQCGFQARVLGAVAQVTGLKVAVDATVATGVSDYTSLCQKLKTTNVQSYQVTAPAAMVVAISTACLAQGVIASVVTTGTSLDSSWLAGPALQTASAALADAPWFDTTIPGVATYRAAIAAHVAGGLGTLDGAHAFGAWVAGQLFAKAVVVSNTPAVTAASVRQGLYALRGETLDGIVAPITYRPNLPTLLNCYFRISIAGGAFTLPQGNTPTCAPDAVVTGVIDKLAP